MVGGTVRETGWFSQAIPVQNNREWQSAMERAPRSHPRHRNRTQQPASYLCGGGRTIAHANVQRVIVWPTKPSS